MLEIKPQNAAILTTFQCTAACEECCFECSPKNKKSLSLEEIKNFINQVKDIETINYIVWTGGECFLLKNKLIEGIRYASENGMVSRCVTNAYWAKSIDLAKQRLLPLIESGLTEINFSTGDDHQKFVPIENILNATLVSLELGLTVAIAVETNKSRKFTVDDLINHPFYLKHIKNKKHKGKLIISPSVWVSFHSDTEYEYFDNIQEVNERGCEGVFETVALVPENNVLGCCGLTASHIPEMNLGKLNSDNLTELFSDHTQDFLEIWIFVDGPYKILEKVSEWNSKVKIPEFYHKCLACAYIYQTEVVRQTILDNYDQIFQEIICKYEARIALKSATNDVEILLHGC